jgi:hypothetical protein
MSTPSTVIGRPCSTISIRPLLSYGVAPRLNTGNPDSRICGTSRTRLSVIAPTTPAARQAVVSSSPHTPDAVERPVPSTNTDPARMSSTARSRPA